MSITASDLKNCYTFAREAAELNDTRQRLVDTAEKTTSTLSKSPAGGGLPGDKVGDNVIALMEIDRMYTQKRNKLLNHIVYVEQAIDELGDSEYRRIMRMRYIDGMIWRDIAYEIPCGERTAYRYHDHALALLGIDPEEVKNLVIL